MFILKDWHCALLLLIQEEVHGKIAIAEGRHPYLQDVTFRYCDQALRSMESLEQAGLG